MNKKNFEMYQNSHILETCMTIKDAAEFIGVTQATIRNWIKVGNIQHDSHGLVVKDSLIAIKNKADGKKKLVTRANKSKKDTHDHINVSTMIRDKIAMDYFDPDALSSEYESSLSDSYRNKEGIYYTPPSIVEDIMNIQCENIESAVFCDPCCGSGNFLIHAIKLGFKPENIWGFDTDPNAIEIAKRRIRAVTGEEPKHIKCADFLLEVSKNPSFKFDFIFTNPPWGKKLPKKQREFFGALLGTSRSLDTSSLFFFACILSLNSGGGLGLVLPDSFLNIASFEEARIRMTKMEILRIIDFGNAFKGLMVKCVGVTLLNKTISANYPYTICESNRIQYKRAVSSFSKNPKTIFNYWCSPDDDEVIRTAYLIPHSLLVGHCEWGIGIVTGDNNRFCRVTGGDNYVPVFKGSDIGRGTIKEPSCYIPSDLSLYQQTASRAIYDAEEKIIYKFITNKLCFFYDTEQRYVLNSANILIVNKSLGITSIQLCDLLNSDFMNWMFQKLFSTHKVLRGDLEQLPIYVDYFTKNAIFDEDSFLEFLSIERGCDGTYRIKI